MHIRCTFLCRTSSHTACHCCSRGKYTRCHRQLDVCVVRTLTCHSMSMLQAHINWEAICYHFALLTLFAASDCFHFLSLRRRYRRRLCFRVVRPCRRPCVRPCVRDSRGSFMFPQYLQYLLTDFRQTFVTGASRDRDDLITFLGQKVKVQGHAIPAEAHSTRRFRRVQLFLVSYYYYPDSPAVKCPFLAKPCSWVPTKFFWCSYIYGWCWIRIWRMTLCHPWAICIICKLSPPLQ